MMNPVATPSSIFKELDRFFPEQTGPEAETLQVRARVFLALIACGFGSMLWTGAYQLLMGSAIAGVAAFCALPVLLMLVVAMRRGVSIEVLTLSVMILYFAMTLTVAFVTGGLWPGGLYFLALSPALAVIMELRSRAVLKDMGKFELQVLYARAMTKLWEKVDQLKPIQDLRVADFGTRRRHSYLWQDWCVQAMMEGLGKNFTGTSNCRIAMMREIEAIGTNAHELPMVYAALADTDKALRQSPYDVLADWHDEHDGNLRIILPDTYGTQGFLDGAPDWLAGWTGIRVDSGDPATGAETAIDWWKSRGEDPRDKLIIFSDGLDVDKISALHKQFAGRVRVSFGWGTMLTNDFKGLVDGDALAPFSLVCKAVTANGRPTVKLSDNPRKAMGPADEIARYKRVFGVGSQEELPVLV